MTDLNADLNATIAAAVNAQVTARVAEAMAGDDFLKTAVSAALNQEVTIRTNYKDVKTTYMNETLRKAFQKVVESAVAKVLAEEQPAIEEEIRLMLLDRSKEIAQQFGQSLVDHASKNYGIAVSVRWPDR